MTDETNYENLPDEELEKLFNQAKKQEKIDYINTQNKQAQKRVEEEKAEQKKQQEEQEKARYESVKQEVIENLLQENPDFAPSLGITQEPEKKGQPDKHAKAIKLADTYMKNHNYKWLNYENDAAWAQPKITPDNLFENTGDDEYDGCRPTLTSWSPDDIYANVIWQAMHCTANLWKVCVKGININSGDGLTVQIKTISQRDAPQEVSSCTCLDCKVNTFDTKSLTLKQYGDYAVLCGLDMYDVGDSYMSSVIESMSLRWQQFFDATIYSELETAAPGATETLGVAMDCDGSIQGSCCSLVSDLYRAVLRLDANMREGTQPYQPDYCIVSPTVANFFKFRDGLNTPPWMAGQVTVQDGILTKIGHLKVIEYCGANTCTDESAEVIAIVLDSRRAVGAAFGQRPKMYKEFDIQCNAWKITFWSYFACAELDTAAIGHVVNP